MRRIFSLYVGIVVCCAVVHLTQCAKRINVKKRMAEGLAKRELQRRLASDREEILDKRDTIDSNTLLETFLKIRKVRSHHVNINHKSSKQNRRDTETKDEVKEVEETLDLQKGEHLEKTDEVMTPTGIKKEKLVEKYEGLEVIGEGVVVEIDENDEVTGEIIGDLIEGIAEDVPSIIPSLDATQALDVAVDNEMDDPDDVIFEAEKDAKLVIYVEDSPTEDVKAFLAWKLSYVVERSGKISRPFYVIEAFTGGILNSWQGLNMAIWRLKRNARMNNGDVRSRAKRTVHYEANGVGGNAKAGIRFYGKGLPGLEVTQKGDTCYLENTRVKVLHMNFTWAWEDTESHIGREAHSFECDTGDIDLVNEAYSVVNDAFYFANVVYDMYWMYYGVQALKGKIVARIHFGQGFENAFWDGRYITFGDGNNTFYPLVTMDIMGHELGHGFTEHHSGLIYAGQSGGINEAFSDMAGETAEAYGFRRNDWMEGYDAFKEGDKALRYFEDPTKDGKSIGHAGDYCPGINVHYSSGVFNRAFYLLANTEGWDIFSAFQVFVNANRFYWKPSTNYVGGACGVKQAAWDWGYNEQDVVNAFREVGIEPCESITGSTGFNTYELFAFTGETVTFNVNVPLVDYVRFETFVDAIYLRWYYNETISRENLDMKVISDKYTLESAGETSQELIEISDPVAGEHRVELHATLNFSKVSLYAIVDEEILESGLMVEPYPQLYNMTFEVPQDLGDVSVAVRVRSPANTTVYAAVRYGEPIDFENWLVDYWGSWIYIGDDGVIVQVLVCKPEPGTYYMTMTAGNNQTTEVSVEYMHLLPGQRVV